MLSTMNSLRLVVDCVTPGVKGDRIGLTAEERGTVDERCRDWNRRPQGQGQGQGRRSSYAPVVLRIV